MRSGRDRTRFEKAKAVTTRERIYLMLGDLALVWVGLFLALVLRLDSVFEAMKRVEHNSWFLLALSVALVIVFWFGGFYHRAWKYVGIRDAAELTVAIGITFAPFQLMAFSMHGEFPRSGLLIGFFLVAFLLGGFRLVFRVAAETRSRQGGGLRYLVVGLNNAAEVAVRELQRSGGTAVGLVGLSGKRGDAIRGCPYLGEVDQIPDLVETAAVDGLVLAGLSAAENARVVKAAASLEMEFRAVPQVSELLKGELEVATLRPLQLEDLLEREPVTIDRERVGEYLKDESVLVTGAGGSIGSEIVRQVLPLKPKRVVLFGRGENSIHEILCELNTLDSGVELVPFVGNVCDRRSVSRVFKAYQPSVVFHAAAHKHVPLMEARPVEACANNIFGTLNLMEFCQQNKVKKLVALSTDKAVAPTSIMGATKRVMELLLHTSKTAGFAVVRFGNVLGSRGSVVPTLRRQIEAGGPVTVTSEEMQRYFMTIPEAVALVIGAGSLTEGGEIYVLEMGKPVKIMDLAENLIRLSGLEPGKDIEISITGVRPGEKLSEELVDEGEESNPSGCDGIVRVTPSRLSPSWPGEGITALRKAVESGDDEAARRLLFELLEER